MTIIRLTFVSILLCAAIYLPCVLIFAKAIFPEKAAGSLVRNDAGEIVGSSLVAQAFTGDRYFHPRPSACGYDASASCGSNLSPASPLLAERAVEIIAANSGNAGRPIPADLVTASGSGLDPHITLAAARYQLPRIAEARGIPAGELEKLLPSSPIVNVLELNLALDRLKR